MGTVAEGEEAVGLSAHDLRVSVQRIRDYAQPYQDLLVRREQGNHLVRMIEGLTSGLERKSVEPIAVMHGIERKLLQRFVGENGWNHDPLREHQRKEILEEIGTPNASLILDGSATPKKGHATVGVARQWCGRLGKVDSCVVGVYATYVGRDGLATIVDSQLYLPEKGWIDDPKRREEAYVPEEIEYRTQAELALEMTQHLSKEMVFDWVLGDDEFGRSRAVRDGVFALGKNYAFDVPRDTRVRRLSGKKSWRADELAKTRRAGDWSWLHVRDGEKGPCEVVAFALPVMTRRKKGVWVSETLLVMEHPSDGRTTYCLARSHETKDLLELVRRAGQRHRIEEVFEEAKGEVGLDHFEVRSWHGWHHHMTLCQIAHWFLVREKRRLGKKSSWHHRQHDPERNRASAIPGHRGGDGRAAQLSARPERGGATSALEGTRVTSTAPYFI